MLANMSAPEVLNAILLLAIASYLGFRIVRYLVRRGSSQLAARITALEKDQSEIVAEVRAVNHSLAVTGITKVLAPGAPVNPAAFGTPAGGEATAVAGEPPVELAPRSVRTSCSSCEHFNKELWQQELAKNPLFSEAARWIGPNQMALPVAVDDKGEKLPDDQQPKGPLPLGQDDWGKFGVCMKEESPNYSVAIHGMDSCEFFSPGTAAAE